MRVNPVNVVYRSELSGPGRIAVGYKEMAKIVEEVLQSSGSAIVGLDGMWGVDFAAAVQGLMSPLGNLEWIVLYTTEALRDPSELAEVFQPYLTDNPVFGRLCDLDIHVYFQAEKFHELGRSAVQAKATARAKLIVVAGPGAVLALPQEQIDCSFYLDMTREEITRRQKGDLVNLAHAGSATPTSGSAGEKYKHAYYVEWPILERYRQEIIQQVEWYVAANDAAAPRLVQSSMLREMIAAAGRRPFRCKPYFQPGVWGGQRLKEAAGLDDSFVNSAWDFEIVAPENSIVLSVEGADGAIEIPFALMMVFSAESILGEQGAGDFGQFFPVRINYLDTMGGTNLSCQVHPHDAYIRQNFGEPFAQNESYYVVEAKPGAVVYLGLREDANPQDFIQAIHQAEKLHVPFDIAHYVNAFPSKPGDYFLIPAGTVHCSGADNLVLEISSTPYWYTFKLYDYLRPDLNGQPRPINSQYGLDVLDITKNTRWVKQHLIPEPRVIRREAGGWEEEFATTHLAFFGTRRLTVVESITNEPNGYFEILVLVAGEKVQVTLEKDPRFAWEMRYLESLVIPAVSGKYTITNQGSEPCKLVRVYIKH